MIDPVSDAPVPGLGRRIACMLYEALLLTAVGLGATFVVALIRGTPEATGSARLLLQLTLGVLYAGYFLVCWIRSGQTLAMQTWRVRLVAPGIAHVPLRRAVARLLCATLFVGSIPFAAFAALLMQHGIAWVALALAGVGLGWTAIDRERLFLHDRLSATRLVLTPPRR